MRHSLPTFQAACLIVLLASWGIAGAGAAAPAQSVSKASIKRSQAYLRAAMERPMAPLLASAATMTPEDVLIYGLALQLGRPPATADLSPEQTAKLEADTRRARDFYRRAGPPLEPDAPVLDTPDFWTYVAPNLFSHIEVNRLFSNENKVSTTYLLRDEVSGLANESEMTTHRVVETRDVTASQTCAVYAQASAVLRATLRRTDREAPAGPSRAKAQNTYDGLVKAGHNACFDKAFFDEVSAFAEANLKP